MQPEPPTYNNDAGQPREARDSLLLKAQVTEVASGRRFTTRVRNLSSGGMMADRDGPLEVGAEVEVSLRGIDSVRGVVAWVSPLRFGVRFHATVDPLVARQPISKALPYHERPVSHVAGLFNSKLKPL